MNNINSNETIDEASGYVALDTNISDAGTAAGELLELSKKLHEHCIIFQSDGFTLEEVILAVKDAEIKVLKNGDIILEKDQRVAGVYVVNKGKIEAISNNKVFYTIEPMDFFGFQVFTTPYFLSEKKYQSFGDSEIVCEYLKKLV